LVDVNEEDEPLFVHNRVVDFKDPRMVSEMVFVGQGIQFPRPGEYRLQLFANNEFMSERRILVFGPQAGESLSQVPE
jgi:hypothetical protein